MWCTGKERARCTGDIERRSSVGGRVRGARTHVGAHLASDMWHYRYSVDSSVSASEDACEGSGTMNAQWSCPWWYGRDQRRRRPILPFPPPRLHTAATVPGVCSTSDACRYRLQPHLSERMKHLVSLIIVATIVVKRRRGRAHDRRRRTTVSGGGGGRGG